MPMHVPGMQDQQISFLITLYISPETKAEKYILEENQVPYGFSYI